MRVTWLGSDDVILFLLFRERPKAGGRSRDCVNFNERWVWRPREVLRPVRCVEGAFRLSAARVRGGRAARG